MNRLYVIFDVINMMRAVEASTGLESLDPTSREILSSIAIAEARNEAPRVTDIVKAEKLGTAPTLYARVAQLEQAGWISAGVDPADKRVRRLTLTSKARKAYSMMSAGAFKIFERQ